MKTITFLKKQILVSFLLLSSSLSIAQTLSQNYNAGQNYYSANFQKNLDLVNTVFNKTYSTYNSQNPGNLNAEFLSGPWPPSTGQSGSTHKGVDFRAQQPFDLYSPLSGVVTAFGGTSGKICIYNSTHNLTFVFIHCSIYSVSVGQNISVGQCVGKTGEVGAPNAPHLHVELRSGSQNFAATSDSLPSNSYDPRIIIDFFPICSTTSPITATPANNQTNVGIPVTFNWDDISGSNPQYRIQVSNSSNGWSATNGFTTSSTPSINIPVNEGALSVSTYAWDTLPTTTYKPLPFTTYYYSVKAFVCGQSTAWSPVKSFTTGCVATTPIVTAPSNGQANVTVPVNFNWNDSSGTNPIYRIQVSTSSSNWTIDDGFTTATTPNPVIRVNENVGATSLYSWSGTSYPPQNGVNYYWTVKTFACGNNSQWSAVRSFTIGNVSNCNIPTIAQTNPSSGTNYNVGQIISLQWLGTANGCNIQDYQIEITAPNGNATSPIQTSTVFDFTAPSNGIGTWQWRVRARNSDGIWSNYTAIRMFTISQATSNYTISTTASPTVGGTTSGDGSYNSNSSCYITATPNAGYSFVNWTENGTLFSTNQNLTFTVTGNKFLTANFNQNPIASCFSCPDYDFSPSINSSWGSSSNAILSNGCKTYRFLAQPGKTYNFKTGCGNGASASFDTVLDLFDNNCNFIMANDDSCSTQQSILSWTCNYLSQNWIYLKVTGWSGTDFGSFVLTYMADSSLDITYNGLNNNLCIVSPNPFRDFLTIETKEDNLHSIQLIDLLGKIIKQEKVSGNSYKLNLENLPQAVYILEVISDKGLQRVKVVKQ